jgi:MFS family permease
MADPVPPPSQQGAGGGGLLTLVLIITSDVVSLQERGKYQGLTEATVSLAGLSAHDSSSSALMLLPFSQIAIANGIGPVLGGVLSEKVDWRWCFWYVESLAPHCHR